jgi:two-component system CheB/CheR fusion protein
MNSSVENQDLEDLLIYVRDQRGFDFTSYKRGTLCRRISRRMQDVNVDDFDDYRDFLEVHPDEFHLLFDTILINVTSFFRDPPAWNFVAEEVIPRMLDLRRADDTIRVWCAGCASGEEAYTIGMLLADALGADFVDQVKIYATDIDEDALSQARHGTYPVQRLHPVPEGLRDKYFTYSDGDSQAAVIPELRRVAVFGRHDLIEDSPISRLDLLICRNTLMYFNRETQDRTLSRFHFALKANGVMFLGRAEMLLAHGDLFTPIQVKHRLFAKLSVPVQLGPPIPAQAYSGRSPAPQEASNTLSAAYEAGEVAQVVVDVSGRLVLANQAARTLFSLTRGDYGRLVKETSLSGQVDQIDERIEEAVSTRSPVVLHGLRWMDAQGVERYTDVFFVPLIASDDSLDTVSISFTDETSYHHLQEEMKLTKKDLEEAYDEVQSANEALQTANEELETTNEELQSANEELETTNEELETMNEELQSTNEELQTTNDELGERTDQLDEANSFLDFILSSLDVGVAVLNESLEVALWNHQAEELWGLRAAEVLGQHFYNLDIGLPLDQLKGCIRGVQKGKMESEVVELDATDRRGKAIRCLIRCIKLERLPADGSGLVITMQQRAT